MFSPEVKQNNVTAGFRDGLKEKICTRQDFYKNQQNVHTPFSLCKEMVGKLKESSDLTNKTILTINLEFVDILCYDFGVKKENVWFVTECLEKAEVALKHPRYVGVNVIIEDYLSIENTNMKKFDVIVGNPPYQTKSDASNTKTQSLWDKFVVKSFDLLKENGHLCMVHPSGCVSRKVFLDQNLWVGI